jgi:hypothetical protein
MGMIDIGQLNEGGIVKDTPRFDLPPKFFTDGIDIDFEVNGVAPAVEEQPVFAGMRGNPLLLDFVDGGSGSVYPVYLTETDGYVISSGIHLSITRSNAEGGKYAVSPIFKWNGGFFHGVMVWTNGLDIPQTWSPFDPDTPMRNLSNWPFKLRVKLIRPFLNFLVGLSYSAGDGAFDEQTIIWSNIADPGRLPADWNITDPASRAGAYSLTATSDPILEAQDLGNEFYIYKASSVWVMRNIGGTLVMGFSPKFSDRGILAPRCLASFNSSHFVVDKGGFYLHNGTSLKDVGEGRIKEFFYADLNPAKPEEVFVQHEEAKNRIWIFYPSGKSVYADKALIWNYKYDTWTFRQVQQASCGAKGLLSSYGTSGTWDSYGDDWETDPGSWESDPSVWTTGNSWDSLPEALTWDDQAITGTQRSIHYCSHVNLENVIYTPSTGTSTDGVLTWNGDSLYPPIWYIPRDGVRRQGYVERLNLSVAEQDAMGAYSIDRSVFKHLTELYPEVLQTSIEIRVGTQSVHNGVVTWGDWVLFDPEKENKIDPNVTEKFLAVAFRGVSVSPNKWVLAGYSLNVNKQGRY